MPAAVLQTALRETASKARISESEGAASNRRKITVIEAGWGSSGYYPIEVLERDIPKVFPVGTHMYMNHPSESEDREQPERRVESLAAVFTKVPWREGNAMVTEAELFGTWEQVISERAAHIGTSIRAIGEYHEGEADGKQGPIIDGLIEGISSDFVTKAGAGGKVGALVENARTNPQEAMKKQVTEARNAGQWLEANIHRDFTLTADSLFGNGYLTREERIAMSGAIGEALDAFSAALQDAAPQLYQRDPYGDPDEVGVAVNEAAGSAAATSKESSMDEAEKQRLDALEKSVESLKKTAEEAEEKAVEEGKRADRAEDALLAVGAGRIIDTVVEEAQKKAKESGDQLPARAINRVREAVLAKGLPTTSDGKLDDAVLKERANAEFAEERKYLDEATGSGEVQDISGGNSLSLSESLAPAGGSESTKPTQEASKLKESFKGLGMSDEAAEIAAGGR